MKFLPLILGVVALVGCNEAPAGTSTTPAAPKPPASIEQIETTYQEAATQFEATKDDTTKAAYVDATVSYATAIMSGDGKPTEKYPKALKLFDEALRLDPDNDAAKTNRQLILDIYKQLGKEPPK